MVKVGDVVSFKRTFTVDDVQQFAELSQDKGIHHMVADEKGRLVVHGLLTATLPTRLGGELDFLAGKINFNFKRQVYTGDTIECTAEIIRYERVKEGRMDMTSSFSCMNQDGVVVLTGEVSGVIFD